MPPAQSFNTLLYRDEKDGEKLFVFSFYNAWYILFLACKCKYFYFCY